MIGAKVFELGRERELAEAELVSVLGCQPIQRIGGYLLFNSQASVNLDSLQSRLGGTIKIGEIIAELPRRTTGLEQQLMDMLVAYLSSHSVRNFGISIPGSGWNLRQRNQLGIRIKSALRSQGRSARFVQGKAMVLSSVIVYDQLIKNRGAEFIFIEDQETLYICVTQTAQNWRNWSDRDFGRPVRDPRRGMLPPKLARMMLNLAGGHKEQPLHDPFCGIGTVLAEAIAMGYSNISGSDIDSSAITATKANLEWQHDRFYPDAATPNLFVASVEELSSHISQPLQVIVSEGYLGPVTISNLSATERRETFLKLADSYIDWLHHLFAVTNSGGIMVLAYPVLRNPRTELPLPDLAEAAGWRLCSFSGKTILQYAREDQTIGRQIIRLERP